MVAVVVSLLAGPILGRFIGAEIGMGLGVSGGVIMMVGFGLALESRMWPETVVLAAGSIAVLVMALTGPTGGTESLMLLLVPLAALVTIAKKIYRQRKRSSSARLP